MKTMMKRTMSGMVDERLRCKIMATMIPNGAIPRDAIQIFKQILSPEHPLAADKNYPSFFSPSSLE